MEIKQDYITGRIDTLIRGNHAYSIRIPSKRIMAQSGHFVKPVFFTDPGINEDGRIDIMQPGISSSTTFITDKAEFETLVLKGQAHFLGFYPDGQLDYRIIRAGIDDPTIQLIKGLLYTWVGGEDETTVLTTSRPGFKTTPQYNVRPWSEFVSDKRIPSMYWRRLRALKEFLKTTN